MKKNTRYPIGLLHWHPNLQKWLAKNKKPLFISVGDPEDWDDKENNVGFYVGISSNSSLPDVKSNIAEHLKIFEKVENPELWAAIEVLETILSQHAYRGIDITDPNYIRGIQETLMLATMELY